MVPGRGISQVSFWLQSRSKRLGPPSVSVTSAGSRAKTMVATESLEVVILKGSQQDSLIFGGKTVGCLVRMWG